MAEGSIAINMLEDWKKNGIIAAAPEAFKANNEERVKIVAGKDFLFRDELKTSEALRDEKEQYTQYRCWGSIGVTSIIFFG